MQGSRDASRDGGMHAVRVACKAMHDAIESPQQSSTASLYIYTITRYTGLYLGHFIRSTFGANIRSTFGAHSEHIRSI